MSRSKALSKGQRCVCLKLEQKFDCFDENASNVGVSCLNGEELVFGCVLVFSFFSTQNQIPQIIIGMGRVIYHFKAFSVII